MISITYNLASLISVVDCVWLNATSNLRCLDTSEIKNLIMTLKSTMYDTETTSVSYGLLNGFSRGEGMFLSAIIIKSLCCDFA